MVSDYIPARGDVIWTSFSPQSGHEQAGIRPAIVLSPKRYNSLTGLLLCCPITRQAKDYAFEVSVPTGFEVEGYILADHIKNIDWRTRGAKLISSLPEDLVKETIGKINRLLVG